MGRVRPRTFCKWVIWRERREKPSAPFIITKRLVFSNLMPARKAATVFTIKPRSPAFAGSARCTIWVCLSHKSKKSWRRGKVLRRRLKPWLRFARCICKNCKKHALKSPTSCRSNANFSRASITSIRATHVTRTNSWRHVRVVMFGNGRGKNLSSWRAFTAVVERSRRAEQGRR